MPKMGGGGQKSVTGSTLWVLHAVPHVAGRPQALLCTRTVACNPDSLFPAGLAPWWLSNPVAHCVWGSA